MSKQAPDTSWRFKRTSKADIFQSRYFKTTTKSQNHRVLVEKKAGGLL